jgi:hypothetical protein
MKYENGYVTAVITFSPKAIGKIIQQMRVELHYWRHTRLKVFFASMTVIEYRGK